MQYDRREWCPVRSIVTATSVISFGTAISTATSTFVKSVQGSHYCEFLCFESLLSSDPSWMKLHSTDGKILGADGIVEKIVYIPEQPKLQAIEIYA